MARNNLVARLSRIEGVRAASRSIYLVVDNTPESTAEAAAAEAAMHCRAGGRLVLISTGVPRPRS